MSSDARWLTVLVAAVVWLAGCSSQPASLSPAPSQDLLPGKSDADAVNPANIKRVRSALPADYEIADIKGPVSVAAAWGFGSGWTVDPSVCRELIDPSPPDASPIDKTTQGFSASGSGGIVYVLVAAHHGVPDPALVDECQHWTMRFGHTTGTFDIAEAPPIEGVNTVGVSGLARTAVESGTETHTQIAAGYAYLGAHIVQVSLITDPGSGHPALDSSFVTGLLSEAVAVLRG